MNFLKRVFVSYWALAHPIFFSKFIFQPGCYVRVFWRRLMGLGQDFSVRVTSTSWDDECCSDQ